MAVSIAYKILFEVRIIHHYFLNKAHVVFDRMPEEEQAALLLRYDCREFMDIRPTESCTHLLRTHRCLFKQTATGFVVALQADTFPENQKEYCPFIPFEEDDKFTFSVRLTDGNFWNYTNLPFNGNAGKMFVFSNEVAGTPAVFPNLTVNHPVFNTSSEYFPGDITGNNAVDPEKIFIAKVKTKKQPAEAADWLEEDGSEGFPMQYVSGSDRLPLWRDGHRYTTGTEGIETDLKLTGSNGREYRPGTNQGAGDNPVYQFNLRDFPEGIYTLNASQSDPDWSENIRFFLLHSMVKPFAVIHLAVKSNTESYSMMNNVNGLSSPVYEIRFRNRATHWRYIGKSFSNQSVTSDPLPLTRFGVIDGVEVSGKDDEMIGDLRNPSHIMVKTEALSMDDEDKYYSDIHIR